MKFAAISGSIDKGSYNTKLLMFMANRFRNMADIDILDIRRYPCSMSPMIRRTAR